MTLSQQITWLFILAMPIACIAWTVTHEEVFREPREFCVRKSTACNRFFTRKAFYMFTCEYCFSHYITIIFLVITRYTLLIPDWRGYVISGFALVWVANIYMSLFGFIRVGMKKEGIEAKIKQEELDECEKNSKQN